MENTSTERIVSIAAAQKEYFNTGATLNIAFRKQMLKKLLAALERWDDKLAAALWTDLHKSYEEAYLTEISRDQRASQESSQVGSQEKRMHTDKTLSITNLHRERAPGMLTRHFTMELSRAAAAQPSRRSDFVRMHGYAEAFAIRSDRFKGHRRYDQRNI